MLKYTSCIVLVYYTKDAKGYLKHSRPYLVLFTLDKGNTVEPG